MYELYVEKRNIIENITNSVNLRDIFSGIVTFREQSKTRQSKLRLEFTFIYKDNENLVLYHEGIK